jgi:hypothetical protein
MVLRQQTYNETVSQDFTFVPTFQTCGDLPRPPEYEMLDEITANEDWSTL